MTDPTFAEWATWTAQTRRNPAAVGGQVSGPVQYLPGANGPAPKMVPVMPVTPEIVERYTLESPVEYYVTYVEGRPDITEGDFVDFLAAANVDLLSDREFIVFSSAPYWTDDAFLELILEEIKGT